MTDLLPRIAAGTGLSIQEVTKITNNAPHRYKTYKIPKRSSSEMRVIAQPARELKLIQRWLIKSELGTLPVHSAAFGYIRGRGIKDNAKIHARSNYLLKMDFKNFFPSLHPIDLSSHLDIHLSEVFSTEDKGVLDQLLFWKPRSGGNLQLSIGAPSSPFLSNTLMYEFDETITKHANSLKCTYSRYADDLTFSTILPNRLSTLEENVVRVVRELLLPNSLSLNASKTVHTSRKHRQKITGLVLTPSGTLSIGRDRKRIIRASLHGYINCKLNISETDQLQGYMAFAKDVEPEFFKRMATKYGDEIITSLMSRDTRKDNSTS